MEVNTFDIKQSEPNHTDFSVPDIHASEIIQLCGIESIHHASLLTLVERSREVPLVAKTLQIINKGKWNHGHPAQSSDIICLIFKLLSSEVS